MQIERERQRVRVPGLSTYVAGRAGLRGERGQSLLVFVGIFCVAMLLGAFVIDQGVWLGKRRVSQKDADTAARGGAMAFLSDPADTTGARNAAIAVGAQNGLELDPGTATEFYAFAADANECVRYDGSSIDGVPAVRVVANEPTSSLFGRLFDIEGLQNLGANATACVGEPTDMQGSDPFYIAPNAAGPDLKCFDGDDLDGDGNTREPLLGTICPIVVPSNYQDEGSRGVLQLQADPFADDVDPGCDVFASGSCETQCTEGGNADNVGDQVVVSSRAICRIADGVYAKQGTLNNFISELRCRILGYDDVGNECPNGLRSSTDAPGEGFCDALFHRAGTTIPPFDGDGLSPPFPDPDDIIDSPDGVDDFEEAFSIPPPGSGPPTEYAASQFLLPNICNGRKSPRIFELIILSEPPGYDPAPPGRAEVFQFATFFVLGCWDTPDNGDTFGGEVDPLCANINASRTALVGIFVRAYPANPGGTIQPCDPDEGCISQAIVLVK